jgi:hypothetical protein
MKSIYNLTLTINKVFNCNATTVVWITYLLK